MANNPKPKGQSTFQVNKYELLRNEYIEWLLLDKQHKIIAGLPLSDSQWSKSKGVTDRTLRYWKNDEEFVKKYEQRLKEVALSLPGATALPTVKTEKNDKPQKEKSEYELIKSKLVDRAIAGDKAAAELYFKTYGKAFVDEEIASRKSDFRDLDTNALFDRLMIMIPVEVMKNFLDNQTMKDNQL